MHDTENTDSFDKLLDELILLHPLAGSGLSTFAINFAAGRLMLLENCPDRQMEPQEALKLCTCLFILFVEEALVHGREEIFSFPVESVRHQCFRLLPLLECTEDLASAVSLVDKGGHASLLLTQPGVMKQLSAHVSAGGPAHGGVAFDASGGGPFVMDGLERLVKALHVPERARLDRVPGQHPFRALVESELSRRVALLLLANLCAILFCYYMLTSSVWEATVAMAWQQGSNFTIFVSLNMGYGMMAMIYPTDSGLLAGRGYVLPLSVFRLLGDGLILRKDLELIRRHHPTEVMRTIHRAGLAIHIMPSFLLVYANARRTNSWRTIRACNCAKSVTYLATAAALHAVGPSPAEAAAGYTPLYPHNVSSLTAAYTRPLYVIGFVLFCIAPRQRQWLADLGARLGVNHVIVSLGRLSQRTFAPRDALPGDGVWCEPLVTPSGGFSSLGSSSPPPSVASRDSFDTAKMPPTALPLSYARAVPAAAESPSHLPPLQALHAPAQADEVQGGGTSLGVGEAHAKLE